MTLFSVIIPTYNRSDNVMAAVESVLIQSNVDLELIVIDDGSSDSTSDLFASFHNDRVRYFLQENRGVSSARNNGATRATGEYLVFLDSDDVLIGNCLYEYKKQIDAMDCDLVYSDMKVINPTGNQETNISARNPYGNIPSSGIYIPGTFCIRKDLFFKAGGYDESMSYGENTELKFRINKLYPRFAFTDKIGVLYYQSQSGGSKNLKNIIASNTHMINKHLDIFTNRPLLMMKYRRAIAVAQFKCGEYAEARKEMWRACMAYPYQMKNYLRLLSYFLPVISKRFI